MKPREEIKIQIRDQGAPIVNSAFIYEVSDNIVAIEIDMNSKYCKILGSFSTPSQTCGVYVVADGLSLGLNAGIDKDEPTRVEFVDFVGYEVFSFSSSSRHTLRVCLTKIKKYT